MREVAAKGAPSRFRTLLVFAILLFVGAKIGGLEWSWWWLLLFVPLSYAAHWLDIVLFGRKPKTEKQVEAAIKVASIGVGADGIGLGFSWLERCVNRFFLL